METKEQSIISQERIDQAIQLRFAPFPQMTMELLAGQLNQFRIGNLRPAARTWEIMLERDGDLLGVASKRFADPAKLSWEIFRVDDSPEADLHAEALTYFYNNCRASSVLEQDEVGDFSMLVEQMMMAWAYRYSAHEMILRVDNAAKKQVTAEFLHCPTWFFESRSGRLRFLAREGDYDGQAMKVGEWLVTVGPGLMRPCSVMYLSKWGPMADWMFYSSRFGLPGIHGETTAAVGSKEWEDEVEALKKYANGWITLTQVGTKINLLEANGGTNMPMQPLVENANAVFAKLWRGGDLSTQSKGDGVGANLQVEEKDVLLGWDCQKLNGTLNARVDRFLIQYLFGVEPKAYIAITLPKPDESDKAIKAAEFLVKHGGRVALATMYERLGIPEADEDEDEENLLKAPAQPAAPVTMPFNQPTEEERLANEAALESAGRDLLAEAAAADLQPLLRRLDAINSIQDNEIRVVRLREFLAEFDQLKADITAYPAAAVAIEKISAAAFAAGIESKPE
jgi:phage gp29-like protein